MQLGATPKSHTNHATNKLYMQCSRSSMKSVLIYRHISPVKIYEGYARKYNRVIMKEEMSLVLLKTQCQDEFRSLSGCRRLCLCLCLITQIKFASKSQFTFCLAAGRQTPPLWSCLCFCLCLFVGQVMSPSSNVLSSPISPSPWQLIIKLFHCIPWTVPHSNQN